MSSSSKQMGKKPTQKNPMNKRIPKNPRYKHVRSVVDTGASMTRYVEKMEDIRLNYRYRAGEIFKRLKCTTFAQMVLQIFTFAEPCDDLVLDESQPEPQDDPLESPGRTTFAQVCCGIGEKDDTTDSGKSEDPDASVPFLLLDVRDQDAYEQCHIITAHSFPAARLTRSCNYFTPEILRYKNVPGRVIILYDEDERIAASCATTFLQRDVSNVFMLSGGLKVLSAQFAEGMVTGTLPESLRLMSRTTSRSGTAASRSATSARPPPSSRAKTSKLEEDRPVSRPLVSPPEPPPANLVHHPGWFTVDDIQNIEETLDSLLLEGDHSSSRSTASRSSTASAAGAPSSRATSNGRPPTQRSSAGAAGSRGSRATGRPPFT